jgi:hypothetical protein
LPSIYPTELPTGSPTIYPTGVPSFLPTMYPSEVPTNLPSTAPEQVSTIRRQVVQVSFVVQYVWQRLRRSNVSIAIDCGRAFSC